jgi:hypothetical protein
MEVIDSFSSTMIEHGRLTVLKMKVEVPATKSNSQTSHFHRFEVHKKPESSLSYDNTN